MLEKDLQQLGSMPALPVTGGLGRWASWQLREFQIYVGMNTVATCMTGGLDDYGTSGPPILAWQWALTGKGPTPIAAEKRGQGLSPSHNMMLDESSWPYNGPRQRQVAERNSQNFGA